MWESMTREQLRDEAVRQARIANGAMAEADALRAECRRYRDALIKCATVSGADVSGGVPTWPSVDEWAVQEVQELRDNYDADDHENHDD